MKRAIRFFVVTTIAAIAGLSNTASAQEKPAVPAAFETRFCEACHAIDKKIVGPALKDIALKYKDKADAVEYLKFKIKNGGQGVWGNIPMPASASATDVEIAELTAWILKIGN